MADFLAASPFTHVADGVQPRRLVLAVIRNDNGSPREFVVQKQLIDEDGKLTLSDGSWFPVFDKDPKEVQSQAWNRFVERANWDMSNRPLADLNSPRFIKHRDGFSLETGKG